MKAKTLFDKIWDKHIVKQIEGSNVVLYIDRHYIHEVTSPVAFLDMKRRGLSVFRPGKVTATPDHNVPTQNQHVEVSDELSRIQLETLRENCRLNNITLYDLQSKYHGIVHVIGPELGLTQPGMTIVCGDSHTSTHGAFGAIAFGIGTSEVEMVLASQCVLQTKPKKMRININGELPVGVTAKDIALYVIARISTSGGTGHFIEFAGSTIKNLSMEGRMTLCNMSIECGARGGIIAPDETTFDYLKSKTEIYSEKYWDAHIQEWKNLRTDETAHFDTEYNFNASDIEPMVTFGTNPGMGVKVSKKIPKKNAINSGQYESFVKSLNYMGFDHGELMVGKPIDYVFLGSCTNGRIEDFREFAKIVKGRKKSSKINALIVPGSQIVAKQIVDEGLDEIIRNAGFEIRQPGCSACLAMNEDKIPPNKYALSTSNRNFEGRQGPGSRTILASPATVAASAVTGVITDPRDLL